MGSGFVLIFLLVIVFNVIRNLIGGKKQEDKEIIEESSDLNYEKSQKTGDNSV